MYIYMIYMLYIYIFFEVVIVIMCNYFPKLLKTHFFILQIFCSHVGSFFCASKIFEDRIVKLLAQKKLPKWLQNICKIKKHVFNNFGK